MKIYPLPVLAVSLLVGISQLVSARALFSEGTTFCPKPVHPDRFFETESAMPVFKPSRKEVQIPNFYTKISFSAGITISPVSKELLEVITGIKEPRADLQLNNFVFQPNSVERKYQLNFDLPEKGTLSVRILDASLQELFKDKMCDFDRKYSKSLSLPEKDTYYISINYNDDWFVRKIIPD